MFEMESLLGDDLSVAIAKDHGAGGGEGAESIHALLCAVLLPESYGDIEEDDTSEDSSFNVVLDAKAEGHGKDKNLGYSSVSGQDRREIIDGKSAYNDHGIENLLCEDAIPWYSPAYVELILGISRLQVRDLL